MRAIGSVRLAEPAYANSLLARVVNFVSRARFPDPNGRAEVVAEEPLQNESADHGVKGSRNEHESFADIFFFPSTDGAMMGYFDLDQIRLS